MLSPIRMTFAKSPLRLRSRRRQGGPGTRLQTFSMGADGFSLSLAPFLSAKKWKCAVKRDSKVGIMLLIGLASSSSVGQRVHQGPR